MLSTSGSVVLNFVDATPSGMVIGVSVSSLGGDGFDQPSDHDDGGNGGDGGFTTLQNSSAVTIAGDTLNAGVVGALVESRGGKGGRDNTAVVDYYSGSGGQTLNSGSTQYGVEMDNYANVSLGSGTSNLQGGTRAWGVAAQSVGGDAGLFDSKGNESPVPYGVGGNASGVDFLSSGNVDVFLTSTSDVPDGVVGLLARSIGGQGGGSNWKGDDGGKGGDAGVVTLNAGQAELSAVTNINVGVNQAVSGTSAGILAQSIGGNGGEQYSTNAYGGNGGNAGPIAVKLYWVDLTVKGDKVAGVSAYSSGGNGGSDSMDSYRDSGGNGGSPGTVAVTLTGKSGQEQTSISTSGSEAIGVSAQSIGGYGGSAVKQAGVGQNGGAAQITADANSQVSTLGTNSMGMLAQSIGGGGGTGEDFTSSLPGGSGKGGNGGNGASVTIDSSGMVLTSGQYAHGMVAQSIGGSGGAGAIADSIVALGGVGGAGGYGETVTIKGPSNVSTTGDSAIGVIAQSIGGGGGTAGSASGLFSVGGSVNNSGNNNASSVSVTVNSVDTKGDGSIGILAQSVGGSGGNGGSALGITAVGGSGSSGGTGDEVTINLGTKISTQGKYALGVVAQSIGGGGGNGGSAMLTSLDSSVAVAVGGTAGGGGNGGASNAMSTDVSIPSQSVTVNVDVAVGGKGGSGGVGGNIDLSMSPASQIITFDDLSNGLMAQSIAGGGGNAGVGSSGSGGLSQGKSVVVAVGVGGEAGNGNLGGNLTATTSSGSVIQTYGSGSRGVLLQSVGGSGGAAQGTTVDVGLPLSYSGGGSAAQDDPQPGTTKLSADVSVSVGGKGDTGSAGGAITLNAAGTVNTVGGDADGILLQSIGGGGGLGGNAGADATAGPSSYTDPNGDPPPPGDNDLGTYSLSVAVGGRGGVGGQGGTVDVNYSGFTTTQGDFSDAMVIQSIGAGGGTGGASTAKGAKGSSQANVAVGGAGGAAGSGGNITLNMLGAAAANGAVATAGDVSYGLLAQSIGGGGGQGSAGSFIFTKSTRLPTMLLGAGGSGGNGGNGGVISMNASNSIVTALTTGYDAHGIVLQSIGGGGGIASISGASLSGTANNPQLVLQMGGGGAMADSKGGDINVDSWVNITTSGDHAFGFVAQSIGGGGGIMSGGPGANIQSVQLAAPSSSYALGGGDLNIELASNSANIPTYVQSHIWTNGRGAHGVVLQSIAGGGGIGGDTANGPLALGWTDGVTASSGGQRSGNISLTLDGDISTTGAGAYGVIAQSLSAPGGLGGNSAGSFAGTLAQSKGGGGGVAGGITLALNGNVQTTGENAYAVFAQTYDTESSTPAPVDITVAGNVSGGMTSNGEFTGGAIWIDSPAASTVTIGTGGTVNGSLGVAAVQQTGNGSTTVSNNGSLRGNVLSKSTLDASEALATLATSTPPILLSNFGTFSNATLVQGDVVNQGQVFIGESTGRDKMHVTGDFTQGSQGVLHVGADFVDQSADFLTVDGHAKLDGQIKVIAHTLMPNSEITYLQAGNITPNAALKGESDLFTYRNRHVDNTLALSVDKARFKEVSDKHGVADNLRAMGSHLQDVWDQGSKPELGTLYAALNRSAVGAKGYTNALNDLSPGVLAAPAALKQAGMVSFSNSLMSCPAFEGTSTQMGERDCVWGRITGNTTRLDDSLGTSGLKSEGVMYQIGTQRSIAPNWFLGVAGAYENKTMRADDGRQRVEGDSGYLGVSLKYENGPWTFAGAQTGSYGTYDNTRRIALMGAQAKSDSKIISFGQRLRASYTYAMPRSYIKPFIDLDVIHTRMPSFGERNAGALNLHLEGVNKWSAVISPSVEVGGRFDLNSGYTVRPYASVGVSFSSTDKWESQARLASAPSGTDPFRSTLETGRVFGRVSTGVQVLSNKGMDVSLQYDGLLSSKVNSHSGSLKAIWSF